MSESPDRATCLHESSGHGRETGPSNRNYLAVAGLLTEPPAYMRAAGTVGRPARAV